MMSQHSAEHRRATILLPLLLLVALLLAPGCTRSSQVVLVATEDNTPTRLSMSYRRFTGFKETELTVKEGTPIKVRADIVTDSTGGSDHTSRIQTTSHAPSACSHGIDRLDTYLLRV